MAAHARTALAPIVLAGALAATAAAQDVDAGTDARDACGAAAFAAAEIDGTAFGRDSWARSTRSCARSVVSRSPAVSSRSVAREQRWLRQPRAPTW